MTALIEKNKNLNENWQTIGKGTYEIDFQINSIKNFSLMIDFQAVKLPFWCELNHQPDYGTWNCFHVHFPQTTLMDFRLILYWNVKKAYQSNNF